MKTPRTDKLVKLPDGRDNDILFDRRLVRLCRQFEEELAELQWRMDGLNK